MTSEQCPGCGRFASDVAAVKPPISQVHPEPDYRCGRCRSLPASMLVPIEFDDEPEEMGDTPRRCRDCRLLYPRHEDWTVFDHSTGLSVSGFCATCGPARAVLR